MAIQPITIYVNGQELEGWKSFNVTRSIVSFCGSFSLVTTNRTNFPLRIFTDIKVLINGKVVMNGYINRITKNKSVSGESGTHDITVSGSDNTIDLQQSSMAEGITINASGLTFKQLIEAVLKKLNFSNVKVIDEVGDVETFKAVEDIYSDYGTKYYDFLETYARQRQVLLNTNREGNIVIRRANLTKALNTIVDGDNSNTTNGYISKTINMDGTKIFYKYICYSIYADILDEIGVSDESKYLFVHKESTENIEAIRKTRIEVFQAESVTDSLNLQRRADWEKSFRRSEAYQPEYKVQGFSPADDKEELWDVNQLVTILDKEEYDKPFKMLIKEVEYEYSVDGSFTTLKLTTPEALTLEITKPARDFGNQFAKQLFGVTTRGN